MDATNNLSSSRTFEPVMDELTLVRRSQMGDQEMFGRLYEAYMERIYRYVYFRVADDILAEDITSLVFLKAWGKLDTYQRAQSPFVGWLYRIAHNAIIDHFRTRKVAIPLEEANAADLSHVDEVDEKLDLQIQLQELREALQGLTERQQQVLILKFVDGLSTTEIAQQLGKRPSAVRALQMRGLQGLAKCLALQESK